MSDPAAFTACCVQPGSLPMCTGHFCSCGSAGACHHHTVLGSGGEGGTTRKSAQSVAASITSTRRASRGGAETIVVVPTPMIAGLLFCCHTLQWACAAAGLTGHPHQPRWLVAGGDIRG